MGSDVTVVTVPGGATMAPRVVHTGDDPGAPTVIGAVPSAVDLSGARVVSYADTGPGWAQTAVVLTDAPTVVTDAARGRLFEVTLGGNRVLANPTNLAADQRLTWRIVQDATGSRTLTLGTIFNINMMATGPIVLSTAAHAVDYLGGIYRAATNKIDVLAFSPGF